MGKKIANTEFVVKGTLITKGIMKDNITPKTSQEDLLEYFKTPEGKAAKARWLKDGAIEEVVVGLEDEEVEAPKAATKPKKGATAKKVWTAKEEDLAEMSLEELNMKAAEMAAEGKVKQPAPFKDEVEAIKFMTKDA
jgi:hypothetical protein